MKIAAAVIIYNPNEKVLVNIKSYCNHFESIFIFDNSRNNNKVQDEIKQISNVVFYQDFENEGISKRLNQACNTAINRGFDWLLTMDQDSYFEKDNIDKLIYSILNFSKKNEVAQFGCNYSQFFFKDKINENLTLELDLMITSGSVINLELYKKINGFDEALFIDHVDHDYCLKAKSLGYKNIQFTDVYLSHHLGETKKRRTFKTLYITKKNITVHSPIRCYYILRNLLYLEKKYEKENFEIINILKKENLRHLKECKYYNNEYWKTKKYLAKAKDDFKNQKMGKLEVE